MVKVECQYVWTTDGWWLMRGSQGLCVVLTPSLSVRIPIVKDFLWIELSLSGCEKETDEYHQTKFQRFQNWLVELQRF